MPVNPDLFNKIIKTLCQGQSPGGTRGNGQIKVAFLLEKSVVAKWTRPKLKNASTILSFIAPRLSTYFQN